MRRLRTDHSLAGYKTVIECRHLWAWYRDGEPVLRDISFEIPADKHFILLCGPNGSGKTTLLRILRGLGKSYEIKTKGELYLAGVNPLNELPESIGDRIGIVFQRPSIQLFNNRVFEEVISGPLLLGYTWKEALKDCESALEITNLSHLKKRNVFQFSGGEQQKTVIAAILAMNPKLLLLDEPTSYLDLSRKELLNSLSNLSRKGITIFMTSHRLDEEIRYADWIIVLDKGVLKLQGTPEDLMFKGEMNNILPPRNFLIISNKLFQKKGIKILYPKELEEITLQSNFSMSKIKNKPTKKTALRFKDVWVKYPNGVVGLKKASFDISEGITVILGPNGSGKTTIAKGCLKLLKLEKGKIFVEGVNIADLGKREISKLIGYITQDPSEMIFCDNVYREVEFGVKNLNLDEPKERVEKSLKALGIEKLSKKLPETLSMGQQRLLTIAINMAIGEQKVVFFDEPEFALDPKSLDFVLNAIIRISKNTACIILTHDANTFVPLADYLVLLNSGEVSFQGNPRNLTKEMIKNCRSEPPDLYDLWKRFPEVKRWENLGDEVMKYV